MKKITFHPVKNAWEVRGATVLLSFFDGHIVKINPTKSHHCLFQNKKVYEEVTFGENEWGPCGLIINSKDCSDGPKYWVKFTKNQWRTRTSGLKENLYEPYSYTHFQTFKEALFFILKTKFIHWTYPITKYYDRYSRQK